MEVQVFVNLFHVSRREEAIANCLQIVENDLGKELFERNQEKIISTLKTLLKTFNKKWQKCYRNWERFCQINDKWLHQILTIPVANKEQLRIKESRMPGRHLKNFNESSERSKRMIVGKYVKDPRMCADLALKIAHLSARRSGEVAKASLIKSVINNQHNIDDLNKSINSALSTSLSPLEALSMFLEGNFTKAQYMMMRNISIQHNHKLYPSYNSILEVKKECRPNNITVTETSASVPLQDLLDHTISRIIQYRQEEISSIECSDELTLIVSWGFDGSTGQSQYNQKGIEAQSDSSLFAATLIPLRLIQKSKILWVNATPASVRFCRPIRLLYAKETKELTLRLKKELEDEIEALRPVEITLTNGVSIKIGFSLHLTLIDGKCLSAILNIASCQRCPICNCLPSDMNNLNNLDNGRFKANPKALIHGISVLHCWIRFFEALFNLSCRLAVEDLKRRKEKKSLISEELDRRKKELQADFWEKMSLNVNKPRQGGSGTSTTGLT